MTFSNELFHENGQYMFKKKQTLKLNVLPSVFFSFRRVFLLLAACFFFFFFFFSSCFLLLACWFFFIFLKYLFVPLLSQIHCFNDSEDYAKRILSEFPNAYFGITGAVTFEDAKRLQSLRKYYEHIIALCDFFVLFGF